MIQKRLSRAGLAKQTGKDALAATPTFGFGVMDGKVVEAPIDQPAEEVTADSRINPGANRLEIIPGMNFGTRAYARLMGLLLYGGLGSISTTGTGPYTHTITPADDLPWLTGFGRMGGEYHKLHNLKIDELTISWDGPGPVKVAAKLVGTNLEFLASAWTATNDEKDATVGKFRGAGGSFKLDIDSAVPVIAPVRSGEIKLANNLEAVILADSIRPNEVFPRVHAATASLGLKPDDLLRWREIITGTAAGTAVQDTPVYGSFEVKFVIDANTDLTIAATRIPFLADFPDSDPAGGAQDLQVAGGAFLPATGAAITATLKNAVASY